MQNKIIAETKLLDDIGNVLNPGYATNPFYIYDKKAIKISKSRIKEWDYYYIGNEEYAVALTIADNGYMSLVSASLLDFKSNTQITKSEIGWFSMGKLGLPESSSEGVTKYSSKKIKMEFSVKDKERRLTCEYKKFSGKDSLIVDINLTEMYQDSMVIATPFHKPKHFYLNEKINGMKPLGSAKLGDKTYLFDDNSFGLLDWGRGVWTYKNTWYWSSASGIINGELAGFNLGYGFGDLSKASENMFFYKGVAHKLDDIYFDIPKKGKKDDYMSEWKVHDKGGKIDLKFTPVLNRHANTNVIVIGSNQDQVFGYFSGYVMLEDGTKLEISNLFGFAEKVRNKW